MYYYINYFKIKYQERAKFDELTNENLIDLMHHQYKRFESATLHINKFALWQKWLRK